MLTYIVTAEHGTNDVFKVVAQVLAGYFIVIENWALNLLPPKSFADILTSLMLSPK